MDTHIEKYNNRIMNYNTFVNEMFMSGRQSENDKLALSLVNKFYDEFKKSKNIKSINYYGNYIFKLSNEDIIDFDTIQWKKYKMTFNNKPIEISKKTYEKIGDIVKHISKLKKTIELDKEKDELKNILGMNIKKYVEEKFDFYYNFQRNDPHFQFFTIHSSVIGDGIFCDFGTTKSESSGERYVNDISSIYVFNKNIVFNYSYKKYMQYRTFSIEIEWGDSLISKWLPKIKEIVPKKILTEYETFKSI